MNLLLWRNIQLYKGYNIYISISGSSWSWSWSYCSWIHNYKKCTSAISAYHH